MTSWTIVVDNSKVVDNTMQRNDTFVVDTYLVDNTILMDNTIVEDYSKGDGQYHVSSFSPMIVSLFLHLSSTTQKLFLSVIALHCSSAKGQFRVV